MIFRDPFKLYYSSVPLLMKSRFQYIRALACKYQLCSRDAMGAECDNIQNSGCELGRQLTADTPKVYLRQPTSAVTPRL